MTKIKFIVRCVNLRERMPFVDYLRKNLPDATYLYHNGESGNENAMENFLKAMEVSSDIPCLHLEDDIILTGDFENKVLTEIRNRKNNVIQFFSMRSADVTVGSRWDNKFSMNQCFYLPPGYSKMILEYYRMWDKKEVHRSGYDILINDFLKSRHEKHWICVPSLVQHRVAKSIINPKRSSKRQSLSFSP